MTRRHALWMLAAAALASCAISEAKGGNDVTIDLSSVTLGDDCAPPAPVKKPAAPAKSPSVVASESPDDSPATPAAPARCAPGVACGRGRCEQTSMQLSITSSAGMKPTTVKVSKVELLDDKGKVLEVLTAREPSRWTTDGSYAAWDQTLDAKQNVKVSYALTAPNWTKHTNGRWNAHSKTFQLRVTMSVGTGKRTVLKQALAAARLPPAVPT